MSLITQNQFLKAQLDNITELYTYHVVPKLSKRNKAIAIGTAITLSLIALFNEKVLKPPKKLRHIPHISIFNMLIVFIRGESYWERAHRAQIPLLNQPDSKGLYLVTYLIVRKKSHSNIYGIGIWKSWVGVICK